MGTEAFQQFKKLLLCADICEIGQESACLLCLLDLGKLEMGSVSMESKFTSRSQRFFGLKCRNDGGGSGSTSGRGVDMVGGMSGVFRECDTLIQLRTNQGTMESIEYYIVLCLFTKFSNKSFVSLEDQFLWNEETKKSQIRVLARLLMKSGSLFEEVEMVKDEQWAPQQVYYTLRVKSEQHYSCFRYEAPGCVVIICDRQLLLCLFLN